MNARQLRARLEPPTGCSCCGGKDPTDEEIFAWHTSEALSEASRRYLRAVDGLSVCEFSGEYWEWSMEDQEALEELAWSWLYLMDVLE